MYLQEAILQCNSGDQINRSVIKLIMKDNGGLYYNTNSRPQELALLTKEDFQRNDWLVVLRESGVLTGLEALNNHFWDTDNEKSWFLTGFKDGKMNGRLERDIETTPVIDKVKRYMKDHGCNDFSMVMNNLKPL